MLAKKTPLPSSKMLLYAGSRLFTPIVLQPLIPAEVPSIESSSLALRPMPAPFPLASQYSEYNEEHPVGPGVRMLKESTPAQIIVTKVAVNKMYLVML